MVRKFILIAALLCILITGTVALDAQVCSVKAGRAAFEAGQYAEAAEAYRCAYEADETDVGALIGLGWASLMLDEYSVAANTAEMAAFVSGLSNAEYGAQQIDSLNAALVANPDSIPLLTQLAHWLWLRGRDDEALPVYEALLAADPQNVFALTFRASSLAYMGEMDQADAGFAQALELAPENDHVYAIAAVTYLDNYDPERALSFVNQAIELRPDDFAGRYVTRGHAYSDLGDDEAALASYSQALVLEPGMFDALLGQANANLNLGDFAAGLDAINQALEQYPNSVSALNTRGRLYLNSDEDDLAEADFARALELNPESVGALIGLGDIAFNRDDYQTAIGYFEQAVAINPASRYGQSGIAAALSRLGDPEAGQALADLFQSASNLLDLAAVGKPQVLPLDFDTVYVSQIEANAGDTISASAESVEAGRLDTAIVVLANGQVVAFADNTNDFDAVLDGVVATKSGDYTVLIGLLDLTSGDARIAVRVTPGG